MRTGSPIWPSASTSRRRATIPSSPDPGRLSPFPGGWGSAFGPAADPTRGLRLRRAEAADLPFLKTLYASFREAMLSAAPWTAEEKASFLEGQFRFQHEQLVRRFRHGLFLVVELEGVPVGRLYLDASDKGLLIVDLGLLPAARGRGLGRALIAWAEAQAQAAALPRVWLHVAPWNGPALALYEAAGLQIVGRSQTQLRMEKQLAAHPTERLHAIIES